MQSKENKPWYKHPFVWLLIGFPALAIVSGIHMAYLAYTNKDGLVSDSYYKDGQRINERLALDSQAANQGLNAQVILGDDQQSIRIMLNKEVNGPLELKLSHPTRVGVDQSLELQAIGNRMYAGKLAHPLALERWQIELSDQKSTWRLVKEWQVLPGEAIEIKPLK
ncbi:FixH family protein [Chitinibacter fontanus]|uniref:FixH family protein n=1 Tax=Chitinibacter fontanus TaxID=1737446 RepID=A0A7D5V7H8_9NEIS|nr:FixH family protein [Chitinibacter fontanus]QLI80054.1 FixH family protein [Chitinibacter fontanus]